MNIRPLLPILVLAVLASCTHSPKHTDTRTPAAGGPGEKLAEFDGSSPPVPAGHAGHSHAAPYELANIEDVIRKKDSHQLARMFWSASIAQSLVSAFDDQISQARNAEDVDQLLGSEFYCKLMLARGQHEPLEEKLVHGFKSARSEADRRWLFDQMSRFAKGSTLNEVTMGQLARSLVEQEKQICGGPNCAKSALEKVPFRVDPFNDDAFAKYTAQNRHEISQHTRVKKEDLRPGSCFEGGRQPAQATEYDWKNRNWIGSVLPAGHFVITYDDGPHDVHTKAIQEIWARAGMAKPAFFWLTKMVRQNTHVVYESTALGYTLGSHSESHGDIGNIARAQSYTDLSKQNREQYASRISAAPSFKAWKDQTLFREIDDSLGELGQYAGYRIRYFRLPYGSGTKNALIGDRFQKLNVDHFFWRVDSLDWQDKNAASIRDRVVNQMKAVGSGIVLFHDIHPQSVKASQLLVDYLKNSKFKAVPLKSLKGLD